MKVYYCHSYSGDDPVLTGTGRTGKSNFRDSSLKLLKRKRFGQHRVRMTSCLATLPSYASGSQGERYTHHNQCRPAAALESLQGLQEAPGLSSAGAGLAACQSFREPARLPRRLVLDHLSTEPSAPDAARAWTIVAPGRGLERPPTSLQRPCRPLQRPSGPLQAGRLRVGRPPANSRAAMRPAAAPPDQWPARTPRPTGRLS